MKDDYLRTYEIQGSSTTCSMAVIEFDDHGESWSFDQLDATVEHIQHLNANSPNGIFVLLFIHGWKNNASQNGPSMKRVQEIVHQLARDDELQEKGDVPVVGVLFGWRGKTLRIPVLKEGTFWSRKAAANRVASMNMTEALIKIIGAAKGRPDSKCVVVGHSMGGLILEKTISHALLFAILQPEAEIDAPVDLVVSLNIASSAIQAKQTVDAFKRHTSRLVVEDENGVVSDAKGPLMVSITSKADLATRVAFPFGQWFTKFFHAYRTYEEPSLPSQRHLVNHTVGHVPFLHSHAVEVNEDQVLIRKLENRYNDTPYWIMRVPSPVSAHHSDLDSPLLGDLLGQLFGLNNLNDSGSKLKLIRHNQGGEEGAGAKSKD